MNFGMVILNQNIKTMQNYVIWILTTINQIKTRDVYEDIADDVEKRFNKSNHEADRPLLTKN